MSKNNEVAIPSGLNLKNTTVSFSEKTAELIEDAFNCKKVEQFYCDSHKKLTHYLQCLSSCEDRGDCSKFKDIETKLEEYEFLLDLTE